MPDPAQPKPVNWIWDLILAIIVLAGFPIWFALRSYIMYRLGLENKFPHLLEMCAVPVGLAACALIVFIRFLKYRQRLSKLGITLRVVFIGWIGFGLIGLCGLVPVREVWTAPARLLVSSDTDFLHGVKVWVLPRSDFAAIRAWAKANPGWKEEQPEIGAPFNVEHRPDCLKPLKPADVWLTDNGDFIYVGWGGGFFNWGLVIQPETEPNPRVPSNSYLMIAPGAYLWAEDH